MRGWKSAEVLLRRRLTPRLVVLAALLLVVLGLVGCGGGSAPAPEAAAPGGTPGAAEARLSITRGFGAEVMTDIVVPVADGESVMNLLADHADIKTDYGGGMVVAIDGVESTFKRVGGGQAKDWFYWVDGKMADVGATSYELHGGESVWWDYHEWAKAMAIPWSLDAVRQMLSGAEVSLVNGLGVASLQPWVVSMGMKPVTSAGAATAAPAGAGVVLADPAQVVGTPWIAAALRQGTNAGIFAAVSADAVTALQADGKRGPNLRATALVLPCPGQPDLPVLLVVAADADSGDALLARLTTQAMTHTVAVGLAEDGSLARLPWQAGSR